MEKKIITEYFKVELTPQQLNEVTDISAGSPMIVKKVLLQRADSKNRNGRIYPKNILEREITSYNENFVKPNRALGELDHRSENQVELKNVSHIIKNMYWEGNDVYGDIEILDGPEFPAGRIASGLLKRKIPVGISSRGLGSVTETDEGIIVNEDFALLCFDFVSFESTQGSFLNLQESTNHKHNDTIDSLIRDIICNNSGACSCMFGKK